MLKRIKRPSSPMVVSVAALVVALGGTSYAAAKIQTQDIARGAVTSAKIENRTIQNKDLAPGVRGTDGVSGVNGTDGTDGVDGVDGADGTGRWLLIDREGAIIGQSGGFEVEAAYVTLPNTAPAGSPDNSMRAAGNIYIDANEDLADNGITATIALQNQFNQDQIAGNGGRNPGADANPEFSGEITSTMCAITGVVACAPPGTNFTDYFVVSPRNSDGSVTVTGAVPADPANPNTHKRFYVIITGDSSDLRPGALTEFPPVAQPSSVSP